MEFMLYEHPWTPASPCQNSTQSIAISTLHNIGFRKKIVKYVFIMDICTRYNIPKIITIKNPKTIALYHFFLLF